jgi:uncharacterized Tic20 family protein
MNAPQHPSPLSKYEQKEKEVHATTPAAGPSGGATTFGMLCHLLALAGYVVPFGNLIGPFIVWMMKKDEDPFADACGRESLNFQISVLIYTVAAAILVLVFIGIPLLFAIGIFHLVCVIIASIKASEGTLYRYPLTLRFIK